MRSNYPPPKLKSKLHNDYTQNFTMVTSLGSCLWINITLLLVTAHRAHRPLRPKKVMTVIGGRLTTAATQLVRDRSSHELGQIITEQMEKVEQADREDKQREQTKKSKNKTSSQMEGEAQSQQNEEMMSCGEGQGG